MSTITLTHPVEVAGENYTELTFRRMKLKHLRGIHLKLAFSEIGDEAKTHIDLKTDDLITIAARLTGVTTAVIDELDAVDSVKVFERVMEGANGFPLNGGAS
ncbi:MAG: phage tail assembly protein [Pseudomonadota bacterium]